MGIPCDLASFARVPLRQSEGEGALFYVGVWRLARNADRVATSRLSYGMKFWPEEYEAMKRKIPQIEDLEDFLH